MKPLFAKGAFFTGCNYWASHAGTAMWSDWRPEVVKADFERLAEADIRVLRVFPLWPDFQPIHQLRGYGGHLREIRFGEQPLPDDPVGQAGVSANALDKFETFAELARQNDLQLIVGLITGWMSGRLFVPPALESLNPITDPASIMWQVRFVKTFVSRFKLTPAIAAWDLGNECNCMAPVPSAAAAWTWSAAITNAIKSIDTTRPVISGMHSLTPDNPWSIQDQAETTDILTTHPYPYFTPHCDQDPVTTFRTQMHAVAETLYYRGLGKKPCFVEEAGTLGPMFAGDEEAAAFIRTNLFSQWAHGCHGLLWWCMSEQSHLTHAPYDWNAVERELGLFRLDGTPKPAAGVLTRFTRFVNALACGPLPDRVVDGICLLSEGQDTWGAAFGAFTLAKQAGLDIEFSHVRQPIPDASFYMLPSLKGDASISRRRFYELLDKVKNGAVLYLSVDNALLSPFSEFTGLRVLTRGKRAEADTVTIGNEHRIKLQGGYTLQLAATNARILGVDQEGNPAFTCAAYGQGRVYFLNYPIETYLLKIPGVFHDKAALPYWSVYREIRKGHKSSKVADVDNRQVGVTEHPLNDERRVIVAVNYQPAKKAPRFTLAKGWRVESSLYGKETLPKGATDSFVCGMDANDALVFTINR